MFFPSPLFLSSVWLNLVEPSATEIMHRTRLGGQNVGIEAIFFFLAVISQAHDFLFLTFLFFFRGEQGTCSEDMQAA